MIVLFALVFALFLIYNLNLQTYKKQMVEDAQSVAQIIGVNNQTAIAFDDPATAREILNKLNEHPSIEIASLLTPERKVFANYIKGKRPQWVIIRKNYKNKNYEFSKTHLELVSDIFFDKEKIAVVYLKISLNSLNEQLSALIFRLLLIALFSYLVSFISIVFLSKIITTPILKLARVTKQISNEKDYTKRVPEFNAKTEMAVLYNGFNEMLDEIELRNNEVIVALNAISEQKDEIEGQRDYIQGQRDQIEEQSFFLKIWNKDIMASIKYAKTIQNNMLLSIDKVKEMHKNLFVMFEPRDVVSGDFYWFDKIDGQFIFCAADCTGHGVPGAMISIVGFNLLNQIIQDRQVYDPHKILNHLDQEIVKFFRKDDHSNVTDDGMDLAICSLDVETKILYYSGANNSAYIIRNGSLIELKCDKHSLGSGTSDFVSEEGFSISQKQLEKGDTVFLFSDGYMDQFGGEKGKKFMKKRFKNLLCEIGHLSSDEQKKVLEDTLEDWIGDLHQIDDIIVMGIKI
ncbi:MAG: SpoIIE family protein phosphatase [Salinivirgaceae bacterium]|nr:SpoIIE family protein phosphatase [Salinivirgaceae bacterium]